MSRQADDRILPDDLARVGGWHVVLADVDPVGSELAGEIRVVVDDEQRSIGVRQPPERPPGAFDRVPGLLVVTELHHSDATGHRGVEQRFGITAVRSRLADEVEARPAQPLTPQLADRLGRREVGHAGGAVAHSSAQPRSTIPGVRLKGNGSPPWAERAAEAPPTV